MGKYYSSRQIRDLLGIRTIIDLIRLKTSTSRQIYLLNSTNKIVVITFRFLENSQLLIAQKPVILIREYAIDVHQSNVFY